MSDFDKFFAEKLEEEGDFPHRDRNWRQLSQRLDAFYMGSAPQPALRWTYWAAAAAVAVSLLVAGWLGWKMTVLERENAELRQEIIALRQALLPAGSQAVPPGEKAAPVPPPGVPTAPSGPADPSTGKSSGWIERPDVSNATPATIRQPQMRPNPARQPAGNKPVRPTPAPPVATEKTDIPTSPPAPKTEQLPATAIASATAPSTVPAAPPAPDSTQVNAPAATGIPSTPPADSSAQKTPPSTVDTTRAPVAGKKPEIAPPSDTIAAAATPPLPIKPARQEARFRIGAEAVGAMAWPKQPGVSLVTGSGLTAAYSPLPALRVTASADWLRFDVNTEEYVPRFHAPHQGPPMHPGSHDELRQVESSQRQQHYALGLTYVLPFHGWLRPSVRAAHTWVHVSPGLVIFRFEEHHGGGPGPNPNPGDSEYVAEKFGGKNINNIWRFGLGLEHELPRWTFGVWADYSKDLAATESTFDALMLRAGIQYKFN